MKKRLSIISVLLIVALLCPMTALAAESDDAIIAVATTESGREIILTDAPDAQEMGDLSGYELLIEDEPVLTVEQSEIPAITSDTQSGYFSADFTIPETAKQVYLVGLTANKVEEIQNKIIENYAKGADFELTDLSFIDAEKMRPTGDGDDYLCWAATASNMLTYTGWAAQAGFNSSDDVFESFINAFTDNGGNPYFGVGWFMNGVNTFAVQQPGQVAAATAGTGGYLKDYAYDMVTENHDIDGSPASMRALHQSLRDGCGVGLSLAIVHNGSSAGGHAVTCWGYIADTAYADTDVRYYAGLFLTDSDSDEPRSGDRRDADNVLQAVSLTSGTDANGAPTVEFDLDYMNHAFLNTFYTLQPFSTDIPKETDSTATRDKTANPDLVVDDFFLGTDFTSSAYEYSMEKIESNTAFFYTPKILDEADVTYNSQTGIAITMTDADGNTVYTRNLNTSLNIGPGYLVSYGQGLTKQGGLPAGDYTITVDLNANRTVREAYYYNNIYSYPLKVRDSFLLGDTDGNGSVDIMDATKIQRIIAGYESEDDKIVQRASISGNDFGIVDATQIQRFVANYDDGYAIGEKQLYD